MYQIPREQVAQKVANTPSRSLHQSYDSLPLVATDDTSSMAKAKGCVISNQISLSEIDTLAADPRDNFIKENREENLEEDSSETADQEKYVKWGIAWKTPFMMVVWALLGLGWALGHHFYYQSLDGTRAGSSSRQNWAVRFGTALSFLVVTCVRASCDSVYKQYIWTLFKRRSFSLSTVDGLFSATQDPRSLMSLEFLQHAKVAYLIATICWLVVFIPYPW
jgi:hypothetical protein